MVNKIKKSLSSRLRRENLFSQNDFNGRQKRECVKNEPRAREERLINLIKSINEIIFAVDIDQRITDIFVPKIKIYSFLDDSALGKTTREVFDNKNSIIHEKRINQALHGKNVVYDWNINGTDDVQYFQTSLSPIKGSDGSITGVVGICRNINEHKRVEAEKKELEMWLRQSQKLESIGTLASGVAHEINNPLMGIISYAELIDECIEDESLKEFSRGIIEEGKRVETIVKNLLSFARQDMERHSPALIRDMIEVPLSLLGSVLRKNQINLELDIPDDLPKIRCRSQQVEQVIVNLLTNAKDALNQRYKGYHEDKIIKISVELFEKRGVKWVRTTVEDYGTGISPELQDRIFDPFFTTKTRDDGTGLGLSVSYGIVKEHKGELWVESEEGKYTRFHIDLRANDGWTMKNSR